MDNLRTVGQASFIALALAMSMSMSCNQTWAATSKSKTDSSNTASRKLRLASTRHEPYKSVHKATAAKPRRTLIAAQSEAVTDTTSTKSDTTDKADNNSKSDVSASTIKIEGTKSDTSPAMANDSAHSAPQKSGKKRSKDYKLKESKANNKKNSKNSATAAKKNERSDKHAQNETDKIQANGTDVQRLEQTNPETTSSKSALPTANVSRTLKVEQHQSSDISDLDRINHAAGSSSSPKIGSKQNGAADDSSVLSPDSALVSLLKDLSRALATPEQTEKLDANQKYVLDSARQILLKALAETETNPNRIVDHSTVYSAHMSAEAWASGDLKVSDFCRGSMSVVWGKRPNGVLNVTIAGLNLSKAPSGKRVGEFVVVASAKSSVEKGFDIQSQSDVYFWLAKVGDITIDADCCNQVAESAGDSNAKAANVDAQETKELKKKSTIVLQALLTERGRRQLAVLQELEERKKEEADRAEALLAQTQMSTQVEANKAARQESNKGAKQTVSSPKVSTEVGTESSTANKEAAAKTESVKTEAVRAEAVKPSAPKASTDISTGALGDEARTQISTQSRLQPENQNKEVQTSTLVLATAMSNFGNNSSPTNSNGEPASRNPTSDQRLSESAPRQPSERAVLVVPERALAGQYMTAAVIDKNSNPEANVQISFNAVALTTDKRGMASYMVPEDTSPGPSVSVMLTGRPESNAKTVEIYQPLTASTSQDIPRIDKVSPIVYGGTITIDGHNFDGQADQNRVTIDGVYEGSISAASPVQLRVVLPHAVQPGHHSVLVGVGSSKSNPGGFDLIGAEVGHDPKDSKLVIKVKGTMDKVQVHIVNESPDVIRISRGNDTRVTTLGGVENQATLGMQRLRKGTYRVTAAVE